MKYPLILHYNELLWTCMFQMVQMERHFISKWTLVHVGNLLPYILYKQIAGHKAHMNYLHCTIDKLCEFLLPITTRKSSNWVHVLCISLVAQTQEW